MSARRFLGLELAGAKNAKTALATLEVYEKESKIFLLDCFERVTAREKQSTDEALLELIDEHREGLAGIGVNVPLTLPPCILCTRKTCPTPARCTVPEVKWMREQSKRAIRSPEVSHSGIRVLEFTPYTQRPVELWIRYNVLPQLPSKLRFEIDETLGGNRAPLSARMHYLQRHLKGVPLIEAWPKLTLGMLGLEYGIPEKSLQDYRSIESGAPARLEIIEHLTESMALFIYERDQHKLAENLTAFDAFLCALTACLASTGKTARNSARFFPDRFAWVEYPKTT